ncbi:MAG: MaoC family dehydratase [Actinomycetales bacterium]|nr:MaoC family dehydratase [Actinomycetales bacterium]
MRPTFDSVSVGDNLPEQAYPVRRVDLVRYAGASGDFNRIHWSDRVATSVGLPSVIAHGMFTMATAVRLVTDWCGDPGAVVSYGVRFTKPVPVPDDDEGTAITVGGTVATRDEEARTVRVDLTAVSAGDRVLGRAQVVVRLP